MKTVSNPGQIKLKTSSIIYYPVKPFLSPVKRTSIVNSSSIKGKKPGTNLGDYVLDLMKLT